MDKIDLSAGAMRVSNSASEPRQTYGVVRAAHYNGDGRRRLLDEFDGFPGLHFARGVLLVQQPQLRFGVFPQGRYFA